MSSVHNCQVCQELSNLSKFVSQIILCPNQCLVLCSKSHSVSDIVTNRAICRLCLGLLKMKTNKGLIYFFVPTLRVAEVGRLSAIAKNAFNSFVGRIFANSRQKTLFFRVLPKLQQKGSFYLVLPSFYLVLPSFT